LIEVPILRRFGKAIALLANVERRMDAAQLGRIFE